MHRKSTPKVKRGRVQKKNNWVPTPSYYDTEQPLPVMTASALAADIDIS